MKQIFQFLWRVKIYTIIALIILAIVGFSMYKKATAKPDLTFDRVTKETIVDSVSESGNLEIEGQANIASPAEGVVDNIYVENGDFVYTGQTLFTAKSTATEQDKATALSSFLAAQNNTLVAEQTKGTYSAGVDTAKQTLYAAQVNYNNISRWYKIHQNNSTTGRPYTSKDVASAQAAVDAAQQNLAVAEQKLADADAAISSAKEAETAAKINYDNKNVFKVTAPSSGTVSNIAVNPGDKVSPAVSGGKSVLIISRSKNILFTAQINENEIPKMKIGQTAKITVDAVKDKTFDAVIKNIDEIGTNTAGVITFNVYFSLNQADENFRSGMSGNVEVKVLRHENVLTVANAAVKPYQDGKAVQVIDTSKPKKGNMPELKYIPVKTGIKGSDRTEITEGLSEGEEVIINNTANQFKSNLFGG